MADVKISALSAVTDLQDTDILPLVRSTANNKITGANLKAQIIAEATNATQAELDAVSTVANAAVAKATYDANTVLAADSDNTPAAVTMGASTILARLAAGNIKAASVAEIATLLAPSFPGYLLNRTTYTTNLTSTATVEASATTVMTSGAITPGAAVQVRIKLLASGHRSDANASVIINLWRAINGAAAVDLGRLTQTTSTAANPQIVPVHREILDTPGAGSIVYTVRMWGSAAGTDTIFCTAPYLPASLEIYMV